MEAYADASFYGNTAVRTGKVHAAHPRLHLPPIGRYA